MNELRDRDTLEHAVVEPFTPEVSSAHGADWQTAAPFAGQERRPHRRRGLVGPTLLVAAGVLLLFNNIGLVAWDTWAVLWRLWPVILIAIGLDLLYGRRSALGSALVAAGMVVALLGGTWLLSSTMTSAGQETIAQPRAGVSRAEVTISPGVADLRLAASSDTAILIAGTIDRARGEVLGQNYRGDDGIARYTLESRELRGLPFGATAPGGQHAIWDLRLGRDLPTILNVNCGVGQATIDLTGLQLTGLAVNTGVGKTVVTLPTTGRFTASVDAGVGEVVVQVPTGMAARVRIEAGLGNTQVPPSYARQGDWYVSPGYDTATSRVDLAIHGGVGRLAVEEIGGR